MGWLSNVLDAIVDEWQYWWEGDHELKHRIWCEQDEMYLFPDPPASFVNVDLDVGPIPGTTIYPPMPLSAPRIPDVDTKARINAVEKILSSLPTPEYLHTATEISAAETQLKSIEAWAETLTDADLKTAYKVVLSRKFYALSRTLGYIQANERMKQDAIALRTRTAEFFNSIPRPPEFPVETQQPAIIPH